MASLDPEPSSDLTVSPDARQCGPRVPLPPTLASPALEAPVSPQHPVLIPLLGDAALWVDCGERHGNRKLLKYRSIKVCMHVCAHAHVYMLT